MVVGHEASSAYGDGTASGETWWSTRARLNACVLAGLGPSAYAILEPSAWLVNLYCDPWTLLARLLRARQDAVGESSKSLILSHHWAESDAFRPSGRDSRT